jgi:hypothetical protein
MGTGWPSHDASCRRCARPSPARASDPTGPQ